MGSDFLEYDVDFEKNTLFNLIFFCDFLFLEFLLVEIAQNILSAAGHR